MKKFLTLAVLVLISKFIIAQNEELNDLSFNPALYYSTKSFQPAPHNHRYLIDKKNIIVTTETLHLPFVDDFSTNELRSYKWIERNITDNFHNVFGTCLGNEGIPTITGRFMQDTSWSYSFDTVNVKVDSTAKPSIGFTFFGPAPSGCFTQVPQSFTYWPEYYTYTFDSTTGRPIDSTLVTGALYPSDSISYASVIYFATAEPGKLWFDNYAFHNNTYPVNPPTIGVATLDGLNEYGLPYNNANTNTYGTADHLTSLPIDIDTLDEADSVYLSFFYEAQGLGDYPDKIDSLIVEFKDNSGTWRMMWSDTGYASPTYVPQKFKQVLINVSGLPFPYSYYHNTFQFRFRNKSSLYGNNDHWHIDYVRLDEARTELDSIIQDIAFVYPFLTVLKNFTLMPADQFNNPGDFQDMISLSVHNMDPNANNNPPATNFVKEVSQIYPTPPFIKTEPLETFNAGEYSYIQVNPSAEYTIPVATVDSLVLFSKVSINPNDIRPQNDTLYHTQNFNSVMAYDDGSAEKSYGISGLGTKKFAYEFNLNYPDTLAAFQVQFAQVDENVSNLVFNFTAWDSIKLNDMNFDDATTNIFSLENRKPVYIDSVNGFATYKLDSPIIVSGKIYFGWTQVTDTRRLQIGYDLNSTLGRPHMYIFTGTTWKASTISPAGSPMIRLIFDSNFWGSTTSGVIDLTKNENSITLFPNPTSGIINIKGEKQNASYEISVTNMIGQKVKYESAVSTQLNINDLQNGIYLLSAKDITTGKTYHSKIIKSAY